MVRSERGTPAIEPPERAGRTVFGRAQRLPTGGFDRDANFSDQRILPVACITTNSVTTEMMVMAKPVNPFQKKA